MLRPSHWHEYSFDEMLSMLEGEGPRGSESGVEETLPAEP